MTTPEIPVAFAAWYADEFKLNNKYKHRNDAPKKEIFDLLINMKKTAPKTFNFFVKKFRDENPHADLFYLERRNENDNLPSNLHTLMLYYVNIPIDPKIFYADILTKS